MDTSGHNINNNGSNNNNYRKYKRGNNSNPKTKKQLENELNRQRSFYVASPQNHSTQYNNNSQVQNLQLYFTCNYFTIFGNDRNM